MVYAFRKSLDNAQVNYSVTENEFLWSLSQKDIFLGI